MEVKFGRPTLEDVGESGIAADWSGLDPGGTDASSGEYEEEWVDITVAVELQPWPDRNWLLFWQEEDLSWPDHLDPPLLDGRKLFFEAREQELEEAWAAVKARVDATNRAYREDAFVPFAPTDEHEPDAAEEESLARLREAAQRRIDALE